MILSEPIMPLTSPLFAAYQVLARQPCISYYGNVIVSMMYTSQLVSCGIRSFILKTNEPVKQLFRFGLLKPHFGRFQDNLFTFIDSKYERETWGRIPILVNRHYVFLWVLAHALLGFIGAVGIEQIWSSVHTYDIWEYSHVDVTRYFLIRYSWHDQTFSFLIALMIVWVSKYH